MPAKLVWDSGRLTLPGPLIGRCHDVLLEDAFSFHPTRLVREPLRPFGIVEACEPPDKKKATATSSGRPAIVQGGRNCLSSWIFALTSVYAFQIDTEPEHGKAVDDRAPDYLQHGSLLYRKYSGPEPLG